MTHVHPPSPLERVLLATDFSPNAEHAAERIGHLPLAESAEVRLLFVAPDEASGASTSAPPLEAAAESLGRRLERRVTAEVASGSAFVEIIRAARRHAAQLVVLGRHSKKGSKWGLGTTAAQVVRQGSTPVLVVSAAPAGPYARPVVAVDLSEVSRTVLDLSRLVVGAAVPLCLVHAYHVPFEGFMSVSISRNDLAAFRAEYRSRPEAAMARLLAETGEDARGSRATIRQGEPRALIVRELARRRADLVVLGTHGRTGLSHLLLGSVAEWILEGAPCDVLISRPERFTFELP